MKGKIIFAVVALLVGAFLMLICYKDAMFMYHISSCFSGTTIGILPVILFFAFCIIRFIKFKNRRIKLIIMIIIFVFWLLTGRAVGYVACTNEIVCGYHNYLATEVINFGSEDFRVTTDNKKIHITKRPFWRLNFKYDKIDRTVYVGPFIWKEALEIFENNNFTIDNNIQTSTDFINNTLSEKLDKFLDNEFYYYNNCFYCPDYGYPYNNKSGNAYVFLFSVNKSKFLSSKAEKECTQLDKLSIDDIKKDFNVFAFYIDKKYLKYQRNAKGCYYQKYPYVEQIFEFRNNEQKWFYYKEFKIKNTNDGQTMTETMWKIVTEKQNM